MWTTRLSWFDALGERLRAAIRRRIAQKVADQPPEFEVLSDLTQEAMVSAAESFDEFRGTTDEQLIAWACKIAEHKLADYRRAVRRQRRDVRRTQPIGLYDASPAATELQPDAALSRAEEREWVCRLVDRLPEIERTAIRLHYFERRQASQIGHELGRTEVAVRGILKRGLSRLREIAGSTPVDFDLRGPSKSGAVARHR